MNTFGRCFTPTSLWVALTELGAGEHKVVVTINDAGSIADVKVARRK
jgi:hypothetical protein